MIKSSEYTSDCAGAKVGYLKSQENYSYLKKREDDEDAHGRDYIRERTSLAEVLESSSATMIANFLQRPYHYTMIGEVVKRVDPALTAEYSEVTWSDFA